MVCTTMVSNGNESNHCLSVIDQSQEMPVTFTRDTISSSSTAETFESFGSFFVRTARRNKEIQEDTIGAHKETTQDPSTAMFCANGCHIVQNDLLIPVTQI